MICIKVLGGRFMAVDVGLTLASNPLRHQSFNLDGRFV
jgi:hypothetical protein